MAKLVHTSEKLLSPKAQAVCQQCGGFLPKGFPKYAFGRETKPLPAYTLQITGVEKTLETLYGWKAPRPETADTAANEFINMLLKTDKICLTWVYASQEGIKNPERYTIHGNYIILSDCGSDGILIASTQRTSVNASKKQANITQTASLYIITCIACAFVLNLTVHDFDKFLYELMNSIRVILLLSACVLVGYATGKVAEEILESMGMESFAAKTAKAAIAITASLLLIACAAP